MEKQIKLFLDFLKNEKKLSNNTLQSYERDIEQYQQYVIDNKINYLKATEESILNYMEHLRSQNKKEWGRPPRRTSSRNNQISRLTLFFPARSACFHPAGQERPVPHRPQPYGTAAGPHLRRPAPPDSGIPSFRHKITPLLSSILASLPSAASSFPRQAARKISQQGSFFRQAAFLSILYGYTPIIQDMRKFCTLFLKDSVELRFC